MHTSPPLTPFSLPFLPQKVTPYLFPIFLILNGIHSTAWFGIQHEVKSGIFAETTSIAQEGVFFIIVYRPDWKKTSN